MTNRCIDTHSRNGKQYFQQDVIEECEDMGRMGITGLNDRSGILQGRVFPSRVCLPLQKSRIHAEVERDEQQ